MDDPEVPVEAIKRADRIVDAVRIRGTAGVTELAEALSLPKSTVHNHLTTLSRLGYLVREADGYRLGTKFLHLGRESRAGRPVFRHGRDPLWRLDERTDAHCQLLVEENGRGAILLATGWKYDDLPPTARHVYPTHAHLHTNAPGKAILAHLAAERVAEIVDRHGLPERTARTVTDAAELSAALSSIRERGYAVDRGEMIDGMAGVGAAITTPDGVHGAVAAYGPAAETTAAIEDGPLARHVREAAESVAAAIVFARE